MTSERDIPDKDELEFAIFCIENIAIRLGVNAQSVYKDLTEKK